MNTIAIFERLKKSVNNISNHKQQFHILIFRIYRYYEAGQEPENETLISLIRSVIVMKTCMTKLLCFESILVATKYINNY